MQHWQKQQQLDVNRIQFENSKSRTRAGLDGRKLNEVYEVMVKHTAELSWVAEQVNGACTGLVGLADQVQECEEHVESSQNDHQKRLQALTLRVMECQTQIEDAKARGIIGENRLMVLLNDAKKRDAFRSLKWVLRHVSRTNAKLKLAQWYSNTGIQQETASRMFATESAEMLEHVDASRNQNERVMIGFGELTSLVLVNQENTKMVASRLREANTLMNDIQQNTSSGIQLQRSMMACVEEMKLHASDIRESMTSINSKTTKVASPNPLLEPELVSVVNPLNEVIRETDGNDSTHSLDALFDMSLRAASEASALRQACEKRFDDLEDEVKRQSSSSKVPDEVWLLGESMPTSVQQDSQFREGQESRSSASWWFGAQVHNP